MSRNTEIHPKSHSLNYYYYYYYYYYTHLTASFPLIFHSLKKHFV